jgi:predicted nucleic acid-binding protein
VAYLLDTSILDRLANAADSQHTVAANAVLQLHRRGELLHVTPQVLVEFRSVATRPATHNGLGLSIPAAETQATGFEAAFPLLPETPDIYPIWKTAVSDNAVTGKQVHDARLVAVCHVHHITHLLTFNVAHFNRMTTASPGFLVVDPATV